LIHGVDEMESFKINIDIYTDSFLNLTYCDNGKGIDETVQKKIFDPFYTTKRAKGSTGLGLHIVYNLVTQSLGGTIVCNSSSTKGTCFFIKIPLTNNANVKLVPKKNTEK
jgi:signal transduction histidine kinase